MAFFLNKKSNIRLIFNTFLDLCFWIWNKSIEYQAVVNLHYSSSGFELFRRYMKYSDLSKFLALFLNYIFFWIRSIIFLLAQVASLQLPPVRSSGRQSVTKSYDQNSS